MSNTSEDKQNNIDSFDMDAFDEIGKHTKLINTCFRRNNRIIVALSALSIVFSIIAVFFTIHTINYYIEHKKNANLSERAQKIAAVKPIIAKEIPKPQNVFGNNEGLIVDESKQLLDLIAGLREEFSNDGIVAYLSIKGTNINYAVAQSDDNEFYLNHDLNGDVSIAGSVFMDYECDAYNLGKNTVIYGHNMRNGSMFHNLRYFEDREYYIEHPFISLTTPYEETTWEIFSFYKANTDFYYIQAIFPDDESFVRLISAMKDMSLYDTNVIVDAYDKILTLSTCTNSEDDMRYVLNAKLITQS